MPEKLQCQWSDEVLNAYVDGALESHTASRVELSLAQDADIRAYVEKRLKLTELVTDFSEEINHQPLSQGLQSCVDNLDKTPSGSMRVRWYDDKRWYALAASIALLGIGFGAGFFTGEMKMENQLLTAQLQRQVTNRSFEKSYSRVLEETPSGEVVQWVNEATDTKVQFMPIRTMQTKNNNYCREFKRVLVVDGVKETQHGISCREGKQQWKTRLLFSADNPAVL